MQFEEFYAQFPYIQYFELLGGDNTLIRKLETGNYLNIYISLEISLLNDFKRARVYRKVILSCILNILSSKYAN